MPAKAKSKKGAPTAAAPQNPVPQTARPDWPKFEPLPPTSDLALTSLLDDQIVTISGLWTSTLCKKYVSFLASLPLVTTPGKPKKGDAVRVNDRFQIDDAAFARMLWEQSGLQDLVLHGDVDGEPLSPDQRAKLWGGEVLGLNPNIRIYRYSKGQFFDQHYDDSNNVLFPTPTGSIPAKTTWTLLLYLTSPATGCEGGETVFYPEAPKKSRAPPPQPVVASLETGLALLHRHGKDCMLHEGKEVTAGEKWIIRSDLCVKR